MKKVLLVVSGVIVVVVAAAALWLGPTVLALMRQETVVVDDNLHVLVGGGSNTVVLWAEDGSRALIVDTKMGGASKKIRALVDQHCPRADLLVVNTHCHYDHTGGNELFDRARAVAGNYTEEEWEDHSGGAAQPTVRLEPNHGLVTRIGTEFVEIRNMGNGHTTNDVIVYLHERRMLVTGDLVFDGMHPALFRDHGSNPHNWITLLEALEDEYEVDVLVPGHGPIGDTQTLARMRQYFVDIRDALGDRAQLAAVRRKYRSLVSLPGGSGFGRTVRSLKETR